MKKVIIICFFFAISSCKNENKEQNETKTGVIKSDYFSVEKKSVLKDTVFFTYDEKSKWNDFALVYLVDKKYSKDSICTATFAIDFKDIQRKNSFSKKVTIKGFDEGSEWYGNLELDTLHSPLKRISLGYPACGYIQNNYLFYIDEKDAKLVHQWDSSSDSGWGYWSEVVSGKPKDFYFRTESFSPLDEILGDDEMGINEYQDSIHFKFENNIWKKIYQTPKGKVYRSKKLSFMEFHHMK